MRVVRSGIQGTAVMSFHWHLYLVIARVGPTEWWIHTLELTWPVDASLPQSESCRWVTAAILTHLCVTFISTTSAPRAWYPRTSSPPPPSLVHAPRGVLGSGWLFVRCRPRARARAHIRTLADEHHERQRGASWRGGATGSAFQCPVTAVYDRGEANDGAGRCAALSGVSRSGIAGQGGGGRWRGYRRPK